MYGDFQIGFVVAIFIGMVLTSFLASQPIGTSSPIKELFTLISDPYKAVLETNRSAQTEVNLGGESQRYFAETITGAGNLHVRGHPT